MIIYKWDIYSIFFKIQKILQKMVLKGGDGQSKGWSEVEYCLYYYCYFDFIVFVILI